MDFSAQKWWILALLTLSLVLVISIKTKGQEEEYFYDALAWPFSTNSTLSTKDAETLLLRMVESSSFEGYVESDTISINQRWLMALIGDIINREIKLSALRHSLLKVSVKFLFFAITPLLPAQVRDVLNLVDLIKAGSKGLRQLQDILSKYRIKTICGELKFKIKKFWITVNDGNYTILRYCATWQQSMGNFEVFLYSLQPIEIVKLQDTWGSYGFLAGPDFEVGAVCFGAFKLHLRANILDLTTIPKNVDLNFILGPHSFSCGAGWRQAALQTNSDRDLLTDFKELEQGTDPLEEDTDGDGRDDCIDPDPLNPIRLADAGPDQTVQVGSTVQLNGRAFCDPGVAPRYRWQFIKVPGGSKTKLSNARIAYPTFTPDRPGDYFLELQVLCGQTKDWDLVLITARPKDTFPPALIIDFQASDNEDSQSALTWTNPSDSDLAEVLVRRQTGAYPANHIDGTLVYQNTSPSPGAPVNYIDTSLTNDTIYYYAVFSRDKADNWNDQVVEGKNADTGRPQAPIIPVAHPWPMFQHDPQHTGRSPYIGPAVSENPSVKVLISDTGGVPLVVIDTSNNLYFLGNLNNQHGLYAFDSKGEQKWVFQPNCEGYPYFTSSPTLGPDGAIYCACKETILAIDPTGKLMWQKTLSGYTFSHSPLVSSSGTIYLLGEGQTSKRLFALNTEGEILWFYEILMDLGPWRVDPALNPTGDTIYIGYGAYLFAVNNLGAEIWQRKFWAIDLDGNQVDEAAVRGISIGGDGTIYAIVTHEKEWQTLTDGGWNAGLHALDPNDPHQERWVQYARSFLGPAAIGREGTIYVAGGWTDWLGSWRPVLYAFDSQGNPLPNWPISLGSGIGMAELLLVDGSEIVYAFTDYGYLKALDQEGNERLSVALGQGSGLLSMGEDGTLYVPTWNALYAVGSSDNNPPSATEVSEELQISSIQNVPNPGSGAKMKFLVKGQAIKNIHLQIFDLSGRPVFNTNWLEGNTFEWHLNNNKGEVLANGVYLYVITVRGWDGTILRSEVKKLVILR